MKESFYFPHDYNAHNDEKILKLRRILGFEGYGIFWCLIEMLASSSEARLKFSDIEDIAFEMRTECERIESVIRDFKLFTIDGDWFWSERLVSFFKEKEAKSTKAREAAKVRWAKERGKNANASDEQCEEDATPKKGHAIKERKGKKGKESKGGPPPKKEKKHIKFTENHQFSYHCELRRIMNLISEKKYLDLQQQYSDRVSWWKEARGCVDWLRDNDFKKITTNRLRNRMEKAIEIQEDRKRKQEHAEKDKRPEDAKQVSAPELPDLTGYQGS